MPGQDGWLANSGGALLATVGALVNGGVLGGLALLVVVLAIFVKIVGPEAREWVTMLWARKDAKVAELNRRAAGSDDDEMPDAA